MGGKRGIRGINEDLKKAYEITASTLDLKDSPACKEGKLCASTTTTPRSSSSVAKSPA